MKHLYNATFAVLASLLFSSLVLADSPTTQEIAENFEYTCDFNISNQYYGKNESKFCEYLGSKVLKKSDGADSFYGEITVSPAELNLTMKSLDKGCPEKPYVKNENTFLSLRVSKHKGGPLVGRFVTSASIRVASPDSELLTASSDTNTPYKLGYATVSTSLTTESLLYSFKAECKLNKPKNQ